MTTTHETVYWTAGDDWQINATLIDDTGVPFNLSGSPPIEWTLEMEDGERVLGAGDFTIVIVDGVAGKCTITVLAAKTSPLADGRYVDSIRIIYGGKTSTLSRGQIYVTSNPSLG